MLTAIAETSPNMVFSHDISLLDKSPEKHITYSYFQYLRSIGLSPAVCFKGCTLAMRAEFIQKWGWLPEESNISHDFWTALLATAFQQRSHIEIPLVQHRLHERNTSGWIASNKDRVRSSQGSPQCDYELMIELVIKQWNLSWTRYFVEAVNAHAIHHDHNLAGEFLRALDRNNNWYFWRLLS